LPNFHRCPNLSFPTRPSTRFSFLTSWRDFRTKQPSVMFSAPLFPLRAQFNPTFAFYPFQVYLHGFQPRLAVCHVRRRANSMNLFWSLFPVKPFLIFPLLECSPALPPIAIQDIQNPYDFSLFFLTLIFSSDRSLFSCLFFFSKFHS